MTNQMKQNSSWLDIRKRVLKRVLQISVQIILFAVILFVSAGRIDWLWAWTYLCLFVLVVIINAFILPPDLVAERGQLKENIKNWDKVITTINIFPALGMLVVAGLDIRFGWSPKLLFWIHIVGLVLFILGNTLFSWAMVSNYYFSTSVRIQFDRGHTVSTGGPYRYVRHPGYVGFIILNLAAPLILGSLWAFIPAGLTAGLFIIRTFYEDRTLKEELDGYAEYAKEVRYKLLPGIW